MSAQPPTSPNQRPTEAVPLPEQSNDAAYMPRPEVEAITPRTPETFPASDPANQDAGPVQPTPTATPDLGTVPAVAPAKADGVGGMIISTDGNLHDPLNLRAIADPMDIPVAQRTPSLELFKPQADQSPDGTLVQQFVTPQRLRDLWHQLDALQEEVLQNVRADRSSTDTYQQDLLCASSLLLQSPANYDEAREIVYRVRGDLKREKRVTTDVKRYMPLLLIYYGIWFAVIVVASRLDAQFRLMVPESLPIIKLALPPILFGGLGALFNGVMAIVDHATRRRDFDPMYISWYLINPVSGAVLGFVIFIFFVVTGTSFTPTLISDPNLASTQTPLAIWLLAFVVGWQQNAAVKLLNGFVRTVSGDSGTPPTAAPERPTPSSSDPSAPKG